MGTESLRAWLEYLESQGRLLRVRREVSPVYELGAVTKATEGKGAILFEKVAGHGMPVASNTCTERELFAQALGTEKGALIETYRRAIESPKACELVDDAPFKAVSFDGPIDLLRLLPVPTFHEGDAGPYLTAGVLIARDPETGYRNVSINRLQALGGERLAILILPGHLRRCFESAVRRGIDLDLAIAIGLSPAVLLASQAIVPFEVDELEVASALNPEGPLLLAPCETVPLEVPRDSEIVLEGAISTREIALEGPFGEFPKYYSPAGERPVVSIRRVCYREEPIFQSILPSGIEHLLLGGLAREASLLHELRSRVPSVREVHLTPGGCCRYHLAVAIEKGSEDEPRAVIEAALSHHRDIKHVVVVDHDVNIFDAQELEWAVATRCQADRDITIFSGMPGSPLDPSASGGVTAKMGVDSTAPLNNLGGTYRRVRIPGIERLRLEDYFL